MSASKPKRPTVTPIDNGTLLTPRPAIIRATPPWIAST
jgi:hypothetical protein